MMRKDYEKLFTRLEPPEPPEDLLNRIMRRIQWEERLRILKWRLAFLVVMLVGSAAAAVPAFQSVEASLAEYGSARILSLLFSDFGTVIIYWNSFALALLESVPAMSMALFLTAIFVFLNSAKYAARDIKIIFDHGI